MRIQPSRFALPILLVTPFAPHLAAQGTPIGFAEQFALAEDRAATLSQLIPGTEEHYFYRCLERQHAGAFDEVDTLLRTWIQRHGRTKRVVEIENRQALLTYPRDSATTLRFLRQRLNLRFDHEPEARGTRTDLPTTLDPASISVAKWTQQAFARHPGSLDGFEDSAIESLLAANSDGTRLRLILARLEKPDVPNLPALIVRDLRALKSSGFGSLGIHGKLLLVQLDECVRLKPDVLDDPDFVAAYLKRLVPNFDTQWRSDAAEYTRYLDRLEGFVTRLAPAHNSLKAHVLHHRLRHDLSLGRPNKTRFLTYLSLPRRDAFVDPRRLRRSPPAEELVNRGATYPTQLPAIGDEQPLIRSYLSHFFATEDSFEQYAEFVRRDYLARLFAETKILAGVGDMERWYSLLDDPAYYGMLKDRVELEFTATQKRFFASDDQVSIEVDVKNVDTLIIKVFEINSFNYLRDKQREVDASIDLDGLVATAETTHRFDESPLRRVRRRFDLSGLDQSGVFVVELIGNGLSSRAVIRKSALRCLERRGPAGHIIRVLDDKGRHARSATVWFGGSEYAAGEDGEIVLPYSTAPGRKTLILRNGNLASLSSISHRAETYDLAAGIHVDREALRDERKAQILVRPRLNLSGRPISVDHLENVVLSVAAVDQDGLTTTQDVRAFELFDNRESVHAIDVPSRLASLDISLRGRVRSMTLDRTVDLKSAVRKFEVNGIRKTPRTSCPMLGRTADGYVLDLLGRNGEPRADRAVNLTLSHRDFTDTMTVQLRTDSNGRIQLGELAGIVRVRASGFPAEVGSWTLRDTARTWPAIVTAVAGETVRIAFDGSETRVDRGVLSLLETRGSVFVRDAFEHAALVDGFVELRNLTPGEYHLFLEQAQREIVVLISGGERRGDWAVGTTRMLELANRAPLQVASITADADNLRLSIVNAGTDTRVHVVATRYLPTFGMFAGLGTVRSVNPMMLAFDPVESTYYSGREIGDEYRYILERRFAERFPGNMLGRPGLLLNPWALEQTISAVGLGGGAGGKFGGRAGGRSRTSGIQGGESGEIADGLPPGRFADFDFLMSNGRIVANLRAGADGIVTVPRATLGSGQQVHVLVVNGVDSVYRSVALDETPRRLRPRQLANALDPERHVAEQRRIEFLDTGATAVLDDVMTSRAETFDSLASVHQLFRSLTGNADLETFAFVVRWNGLDDDEKRSLYSRHACHELHFFLHEKDPAFFTNVVRPYLANKAHKTFLDLWLLEADLSGFLDPAAFARLNIVERILLAERLADKRSAIQRHVRDLDELQAPDPDLDARLFTSALELKSLDVEGIGEKLAELRQFRRDKQATDEKDAAPEPREEAEKPAQQPRPDDSEDLREELLKRKNAQDARRRAARRLYRAPDPTRRFVEHDYWHRPIEEQDATLITVNSFWRDYAMAPDRKRFVSTNVAAAAGNFAEMMFALAVTDLPFAPAEHSTEVAGARMTITAKSPLLLVRKEIKDATPIVDEPPILVSQNFFRLDEPHAYEGNVRRDAYVTDEFLVDVPYGCRVVITNPTSLPRELDLLLQIPAGAIPINGGFYTRARGVRLGAHATSSVEFAFYFPAAGTFASYPAHIARDGGLVAFAEPLTLTVTAEPSTVDTTSWEHISQAASNAVVLAHLAITNVMRTDLTKIAWRMRDRAFFDATIALLRDRQAYDHVLWSYGLLHGDSMTVREYLRNAGAFVARCGRTLESPLLTIDPIERRDYQHVEFHPLFNPRAHQFGDRREILDAGVARQYFDYLDVLAYRPSLSDADWLSVTYYLLLQDRTGPALRSFAKADPRRLATRLQYDYMRAYLDFFTEDHSIARSIAERYVDHPVERWRNRFREVLQQLDEADGIAVTRDTPDRDAERAGDLAAQQPALELVVESQRIRIGYQNLTSCSVNYYDMDVEFLFSTQPFVQQGAGSFAYVRPNLAEERELAAGASELEFALPEQFRNSNVLIEIHAGGLTRRQAYYANSLAVNVVESFGQLRIADAQSGKPLSKVYAKIFARTTNGTVRFHKDGYTDLRGRFDYASVSAPRSPDIDRFAILVLSEDHGAVIREVAPPGQ